VHAPPWNFSVEFRTSEITSAGCRLTAALRQTARRGQLAMMLHTHFRSSRVHVPTLSRAECKVARAHAKVARAHARVCRGLATPLVATHSGSHSLYGPTFPMATSMRAIAYHKRLRKYHLSVDTSAVDLAHAPCYLDRS